ncbi:hypothetical protein GV828_06720 [Flavobacterium sp. NST-5]|uniref:Phenylalanyl-tRNA synthetase subunit beta n=1 Tax=Flavobacterium ichthyis TaxID=2698827 RepID=A0ABW9Z852_9FLAO|nr:hypothetical protein [Flavobacterium ichthyis]NBL64891.1 hypothetical protein [Flavobacterium ichthyis]
MSEIAQIIDTLEDRLAKVITRAGQVEKNAALLRSELEQAKGIIKKQSEEILTLQAKYDSLKIANSLLGSEENKRDTKLKINSLIRDIDLCIAQLSD